MFNLNLADERDLPESTGVLTKPIEHSNSSKDITVAGQRWILHQSFPIDFRGSLADDWIYTSM